MSRPPPTMTGRTIYQAEQLTDGFMSVRVTARNLQDANLLAELLTDVADAYERAGELGLDPWDKIVQPVYDQIHALRTEHGLWRPEAEQ